MSFFLVKTVEDVLHTCNSLCSAENFSASWQTHAILASRSSVIVAVELGRRGTSTRAVLMGSRRALRRRISSDANCCWLAIDKSGLSRRLDRPRSRHCAALGDPRERPLGVHECSAIDCNMSRNDDTVSSRKDRFSTPVVHLLKCCHSTRHVSRTHGSWRSQVTDPLFCPCG
jgi:hypothetical protein